MKEAKKFYFSRHIMAVLEALAQFDKPANILQIAKKTPAKSTKEKVRYLMSPAAQSGYLARDGVQDGKAAYVLTDMGRRAIAMRDQFTLVDDMAGLPGDRPEGLGESPRKGRKYTRKEKADPTQSAIPFSTHQALPNISKNADHLMDNVNNLIYENASYREAMMKVCTDLAALLGMKLVEKDPAVKP